MIRTLRLQNFKGIRDVEIGLERLTVFVGPNGSGKTSLLQGLDLLINRLSREVFSPLRDYPRLSDYWSLDSSGGATELSCSTDAKDYRVRIDQSDVRSSWQIRNRIGSDVEWREPSEHDKNDFAMNHCQVFRFDPEKMSRASLVEHVDRLSSDGSWLTGALFQLAKKQPANFNRLQDTLAKLIPAVKKICFREAMRHVPQTNGLNSSDEPVEKLEMSATIELVNGRIIPLHTASEGTLLVLGLLTILMNDLQPHLILLEDVDRGLHPLAQRNVVDLLHTIQEQNPDLQIVATTHSPYLVDRLRPEEVRMTTLRDDGTVACGRLDEHHNYSRWKDEFLPGELWSMFGEKWVVDLVPEVAR